jgi:hypothetical protein
MTVGRRTIADIGQEELMTSSTIERLRAKTIIRDAPQPTKESHDAYVAQLRALGADEKTVARLTRRRVTGRFRGKRLRRAE